MAQQTPVAVDPSELSSTPQAPETKVSQPASGVTPVPVNAQELSSTPDPFASVGGTSHKPTFEELAQKGRESRPGYLPPNSIGPQLSTAEQLKRDPGLPLRNKIREIESYTMEGRKVHPILATVGDYLSKVYVPGGEAPNDLEHPLAQPVPPPLPGLSGALEGAASESAATASAANAARTTSAAAPAGEAAPGVVSKVLKGAKVAQPKAEGALRTAASSASDAATVQPQSLPRILEQPIDATESQAKSLYSKIDEAAGTDIKDLREKLSNTEYQIRQAADPDIEAKFEAKRASLIDKIQQAKQDAAAAGVDPKTLDQADALYGKAQALRDVEAKVFKNPSIVSGNARLGQPETIDVDKALDALQKLQYADKYGSSRLEQALGEQNANALLGKLYEAKRLGQSAIRAQRIAEWIGGGIVAAGPVIEGVKAVLPKGQGH
jgi:hypothetical protein